MHSISTAPATPSAATPAPATAENEPRGRGRPQLLTPEVTREIIRVIRTYGVSDSHAGLVAGVSSSSVSRWKQASEEFSDLIEGARAEFECDRIALLLEASRRDGTLDWRAQAWLLRNASREGGWGRTANPLPKAAPRKPEILPKNTPAPEKTPAPAPAAAADGDPAIAPPADVPPSQAPASPGSAPRAPHAMNNAKSVPKIVSRGHEPGGPPAEPLSRAA